LRGITAILPAYNEEVSIGSVVLRTRQYADRVIVVDDGSSDRTAEVAALAGAEVLRHPQNRGKGAALSDIALHKKALACYDRALAIDIYNAAAWNDKGIVFA